MFMLRSIMAAGLSLSLQAARPPLPDRKAFPAETQIAGAQISRDGKYSNGTPVTLAAAVDSSQVGLPMPAQDLQPAIHKYNAQVQAGNQSMNLSVNNEIREQNGQWAVVQTINTPMGVATDAVLVRKQTLEALEEHIKQGSVLLDFSFNGGRISGNMSANGETKPISADAGGPLFAQGPAALESIAVLPLADGYKTTFRNMDVQKTRAKVMLLSVTGTEKVSVPAGSFDCYRIEVSSTEGGADKLTLWVAKDGHKPVKYSAVSSDMGGATVSGEMVE